MGGLPEPVFSVMGRLQAEKALVPVRIVEEANILNLEFLLPRLPFLRPGQMRFVELLAQLGNFDLVRNGKNNSKHGDPASLSDHRKSLQFSTGDGQRRKQDSHTPTPALLKAFFA
jgi:hypothetical protein